MTIQDWKQLEDVRCEQEDRWEDFTGPLVLLANDMNRTNNITIEAKIILLQRQMIDCETEIPLQTYVKILYHYNHE